MKHIIEFMSIDACFGFHPVGILIPTLKKAAAILLKIQHPFSYSSGFNSRSEFASGQPGRRMRSG
jgi:hypothetical protein